MEIIKNKNNISLFKYGELIFNKANLDLSHINKPDMESVINTAINIDINSILDKANLTVKETAFIINFLYREYSVFNK